MNTPINQDFDKYKEDFYKGCPKEKLSMVPWHFFQ